MNLSDIKIYRLTHIQNIPHILKYGITHKHSVNANKNYIHIGDSSLINKREVKSVPIIDNGNIILGKYTPFYFGVKMPMLYVISKGYNAVSKVISQDIIYLRCDLQNVIKSNNFYFSDGHATDTLTVFYGKNRVDDLQNILNWNAIESNYWGGDNNLENKRKKQAEFLLEGDLRYENISVFECYNTDAEAVLLEYGIDKQKIKINNEAYF
jgi:hypothetical protein